VSDDVFDTAALRAQVLAAWADSATRFREDANAEEELVLGGYRDRLVVELAQNAADAATRSLAPGTPPWAAGGRLRLSLRGNVLAAANTGAPLDAAGVRSLSSLRASAKRDEPIEAVGRFGVGFAAVLAVSDEPSILSRHGGVRWSAAQARALVEQRARAASSGPLAEELIRRDGAVPLLRLPWPAEGTPPAGYDTVVVLPLRDAGAATLVGRLLAEIDDALLLALPYLAEVVVDVEGSVRSWRVAGHDQERAEVVVTHEVDGGAGGAVSTRWRYQRRVGELSAELLADRPVEERARRGYAVMWAAPVDPAGVPTRPATRAVVHAPTPTDEPIDLPALLIASLPLDVTRRHVAPGPARDHLLTVAAEVYTELLARLTPDPAVLALAPSVVGRGEVDALLRHQIAQRVPETPFLPLDEDPAGVRQRPRDAAVLAGADEPLVAMLRSVLPTLLPAAWDRDPGALARAGVRRLRLAEAIDMLGGLARPTSWWRELYETLAAGPAGGDREALAALPVPLAGGGELAGFPAEPESESELTERQEVPRTVRGPRGALLPATQAQAAALVELGLRVIHPDATHPLLERLGATVATPGAVLLDPRTQAVVAASYDEAVDGAGYQPALVEAVLNLVGEAAAAPGEYPFLAELALLDADGEPAAAGELMLPGSPIAAIARPDALGLVHPDLVASWGEEVLEAVGVLRTLALASAEDVLLDPAECATDLDEGDAWCRAALATLPDTDVPPMVASFVGVRDLELVDDSAWDQALALLAQPPLRAAVTTPARVLLADGRHADVPSYTAWWLRHRPVLGGRRPAGLRAAGSDPVLAGLYDEAPGAAGLDPEFLRALGVRTDLSSLLAEPTGPQELLDRLADPDRVVTLGQLHRIYAALAGVPLEAVTPPDRLRALLREVPQVVDATAALVVEAPDLLPIFADRPLVLAAPDRAGDLADLLALPLASELTPAPPVSEGEVRPTPDLVRERFADVPASYVEHDELWVDAAPAGPHVDLPWRYVNGTVHSATLEGLAWGLAWAAGAWHRRFEICALLTEPDRAAELDADRGFERP
jgi:hypothetical protein